jgi:hemolysin-activating ACP:hemolysin acyltransferase
MDHAVTLTVGRFHEPFQALGRIVHFLRDAQPFASYQFGAFVATVAGQVERGHYLVVLHDEQVVGYLGYALCDERIAQAWLEGRYVPTLEECRRGDVLVAMTMHTASREVFSFLIREGRTLLPKVKTVFRRHYGQDKPERLGRILNRVRSAS